MKPNLSSAAGKGLLHPNVIVATGYGFPLAVLALPDAALLRCQRNRDFTQLFDTGLNLQAFLVFAFPSSSGVPDECLVRFQE